MTEDRKRSERKENCLTFFDLQTKYSRFLRDVNPGTGIFEAAATLILHGMTVFSLFYD